MMTWSASGQPRQHRVSGQRGMQQLHHLSHSRLSEVSHGGGGMQRTSSATRVSSADQTIRQTRSLIIGAETEPHHAMAQLRDGVGRTTGCCRGAAYLRIIRLA
jgi:hypothetical protein